MADIFRLRVSILGGTDKRKLIRVNSSGTRCWEIGGMDIPDASLLLIFHH